MLESAMKCRMLGLPTIFAFWVALKRAKRILLAMTALAGLAMMMPSLAQAAKPSVTTNAATTVTATGATLNGTVSSNGASTTVTFDYGLTTSYGSTVTAVQSPLASGASRSAVSATLTGLTCGTLYHFRAKGVNNSGTTNGGDLTFTTSACPSFSCTPPSNAPSGLSLTCVCDTFNRATLNPSTIFGANWIQSTSDSTGILPSIVNPGYLRLTNNTGNNAKAVTVPGIFPAAGNYISVEFKQYAYNGSGADGIAVTLSDYSIPAVPGAYGGSLGYAQETGIHDGFAGGWLGVALDEYGNYQNTNEGRLGGPGFTVQSVGARGSGTGQTGYRWLGGTGTLSPKIDNNTSTSPSLGYYYQVVVDARNDPASTAISVNRDTTGTSASYASLITIPNVYTAATAQGFTQAPVPTNWQISFTGSTGGSTNIHEIGGLRICASTVWPPTGGTASGFNAIDEAYGNASASPYVAVQNYLNGHIYMKVVGTPFKLNVAALANNQIQTAYVVSGSKSVTVNLVDNSDGACILDNTQSNYCSAACTGKTAVTGGSQTLTFTSANKGQQQSANFTLNTAYKNLVAIISDGTVNACSTDAFSVRPLGVASVSSSNATNAGTSGTPIFKAGSDNFSLTATTAGITGSPSGYTGVLKVNSSAIQVTSPMVAGIVSGTFPAATPGTPSSTATGNFTYSEVGAFQLPGYNPDTDMSSPRGVFDGVATATECATPVTPAQCDLFRAATWTGVDSISTKGDCIQDSYRNTRDTSGTFSTNPNYGKFGCSFGLTATTSGFGRFVPDHFSLISAQTKQRSDIASAYAATSETTGTIVASGTVLTVADATNFSVGDAVVIFGAGAGGGDLLATVTAAGSGNTLTLSAPAAIGVTSAPVFKRLGFTYMDEPLQLALSLEARNAAGVKTQNYDSGIGLAKLDNSNLTGTTNNSWGLSGVVNNLYGVAGCRALFSGVTTSYSSGCASLPVGVPTAPYAASAARISPSGTGTVTWTAGATSMTTNITLKRASTPDGAFNFTNGTFALGIWPKDGDGITLLSANDGSSLLGAAKSLDIDAVAGADVVAVGVADMRFGRMRFSNAYGSELLNLTIPMEVQYWNWTSGGGAFVRNTLDSSTSLVNNGAATSNFSLSNYRRSLAAGETSLLPAASVTFNQGAASMLLARPGTGNSGSVKVCADLDVSKVTGDMTCVALGAAANMPYLQGGAGFNVDPSADATFGTHKSGPVIYLREGY